MAAPMTQKGREALCGLRGQMTIGILKNISQFFFIELVMSRSTVRSTAEFFQTDATLAKCHRTEAWMRATFEA